MNACYQTARGVRGKDIIMTDIIMLTAARGRGAITRFMGIKKGCRCGSLMYREGAADSACRNAQIQHHHAGGHCVAEGEGRGLHTGFLELQGVYPLAGDLSRGGFTTVRKIVGQPVKGGRAVLPRKSCHLLLRLNPTMSAPSSNAPPTRYGHQGAGW
ncbi:MAG: hypothetical protein Fur0018_25130 [Anaerolineales bacterium]